MLDSFTEVLKPIIAPFKQLVKDAVQELVDERQLFFASAQASKAIATTFNCENCDEN